MEEKQLFIDSIINKYPTPSIILSTYEGKDKFGNTKIFYEIIDGLQRLNAIVSFVNNEFGVIYEGKWNNIVPYPKQTIRINIII